MLRQRQTRSSSKLLEKEKKSEECHKEEDSKKTAEIEKTAVAPVKTNKKPKDHVKMQTKRVTRSMLKPSPPPKFPVASLPKELRNNTTVPVSPQGPKPPVKAAPKPNLSKLAVPKSSVSDAKVPVGVVSPSRRKPVNCPTPSGDKIPKKYLGEKYTGNLSTPGEIKKGFKDLIENEEWDQAMGLYNAKVLPVCTKKDWRELPKEGFDIIAGKVEENMFLEEKYMPIIEFLTWAGYHSGRNFDIISKLGAVTEYGGTHRFEIYISYDVITKTDIPSDLKWKFELVNSYECSNNHSIKLLVSEICQNAKLVRQYHKFLQNYKKAINEILMTKSWEDLVVMKRILDVDGLNLESKFLARTLIDGKVDGPFVERVARLTEVYDFHVFDYLVRQSDSSLRLKYFDAVGRMAKHPKNQNGQIKVKCSEIEKIKSHIEVHTDLHDLFEDWLNSIEGDMIPSSQ